MAKKESSYTCTECKVTQSAVWRRDKEFKNTLCNKCYLKKYPPKKVEAADGNSNSGESKKRKLELVAEEKAVKAEPKDETEIKTEVKEEVKDEFKEELKDELKEEVKEEDRKEKKRKKDKHKDKDEDAMDDLFDEGPPDVSADTDTEYAEIELDKTPSGLIVESSGQSKIDGKYKRLPNSSRGRPAYYQRKEKDGKDKTMYIYFAKKAWNIGPRFGDKKSVAVMKAVDGLMDPCEPYPHAWQVYKKGEEENSPGTYQTVVAMRIYSEEAAAEMSKLPEPPMEAGAAGKLSDSGAPMTAEQIAERQQRKEEKKKRKEEAKAKEAAERPADQTGEGAVKSEGTEEKKDEASSSSDESSSSEEEKEESSDSSSESDKEDNAAKAQVDEAANEQKRKDKALEFEKRIRSQLQAHQDKNDIRGVHKSFINIQQRLQASKANLEQVAGLTEAKVEELLVTLKRDFKIDENKPKEKPRAPKAPPPAHLLKGKASGSAPAAPTTPPENPPGGGDIMPHRTMQPGKSVLRPWYDGPRRKGERPHISIAAGMQPGHVEQSIESFRQMGEELWYYMPGASVYCDNCDRQVPQSMGSLQGALGQSQFAQNRFVCSECAFNPQ